METYFEEKILFATWLSKKKYSKGSEESRNGAWKTIFILDFSIIGM